jgi:2-oxoglutarate ferredoxin oxidoreductase subunit gamma
MTHKLVISGFGGQGVLTLGVLLSELAMRKGYNVSWIPSYGAEMRGGTANCAVIISDEPIGSPMITNDIDYLVAMNNPSVDKFIADVKPGKNILINSSIVDVDIKREDVEIDKVEATNLASEIGNTKVQNMVMLGFVNKHLQIFTQEDVEALFVEKFTGKKAALIPMNKEAFEKGMN